MRKAATSTMMELARKDKRVFIITSDNGFGIFDDFQKERPQQFLNTGINEATMIGMAAGLALVGYKVFTYNIIPFLLMRPYEQVRNDICYQKLPITLVGIGSGITYAPQGVTHYAVEDICLARTLPNLEIFSPIDPIEAKLAVYYAYQCEKPVYIRLPKAGEPIIHKNENIKITQLNTILEGEEIAIIAHGSVFLEAYEACLGLRKEGIYVKLLSGCRISPFPEEDFLEKVKGIKTLICVEEHYKEGGLGTVIEGIIVKYRLPFTFLKLGIPYKFIHEIAKRELLREKYGIDKKGIIKAVKNCL